MTAAEEPTREQWRAIDAPIRGPFLLDAGAGTGKTFTLVQRAVKLVTTGALRADQLLLVTFTNKAAAEIAERIARTFAALALGDVPRCTTFHAFAGDVVHEFAWVGDVPFAARQLDEARARVLFRRVWRELIEGRIEADTSAFPVGVRSDVLERDIATLALRLRSRDVGVADFESRALFAARALAAQNWGQTWVRGKSGKHTSLDPKIERDANARRAEADREARNVRVVAALLRRFDALLLREGFVTFGDVLTRARALAEVPAVNAILRNRIVHALVDEFQDTNPQQLAFLRAIFGEELEAVMAVGDVRQAIYAFNGADPTGIARFGEIAGCVRYPLTENRRSFQQILDAAHRALAAQNDPLVPLDREPLVARKGESPEIAVRAQAFGDGESDVATGRLEEAEAVATEVASLVAGGIAPRAIALLVRSRTNVRPYIEALRRHGVAAKLHGGVGFFDAPEICDARAWLGLLADPADRGAIVRVLQSRIFGYGDGTIARLAAEARGDDAGAFARSILLGEPPVWFDDSERERLQLFRTMAATLSNVATERAPRVVRAIAEWCGIDLVAAQTQPLLAEQVRANLEKLQALAESFERERPGARLDDLAAELDEREALEIDEAEADVGLDRVAIVTAHGAKGLEWEYVFVINVAKSTFPAPERPTAQTLDWHEPTGALAMMYSVEGTRPLRWSMRGKVDLQTGERGEKTAGIGEEARLFYVAMTRAKTRLYVTGPLETHRRSPFLTSVIEWGGLRGFNTDAMALDRGREPRQASFDFSARPQPPLAQRFATDLAVDGTRERAQPHATERATRTFSYSAISAHATCPRYARYRYDLRVPDLRDGAAREVPDETARKGFRPLDPAQFGTAVHRALELALGGGDATQAVAEAAAEFALEASAIDALRACTAHALERLTPFEAVALEARFAWQYPASQAYPFALTVVGAIDAIVRAEGRLIIIDYKTGSTPPHAHRLQLSMYRRALLAGAVAALPAPEGDPGLAILTIAPDRAGFVRLEPESDAAIESAVRAAARGGDEPLPGPFCARCPYANVMCPEGAAFNATQLA